MEHTTRQRGSGTQQKSSFLAGLLTWLVGLFQLTDQEQEDAGIYLGDRDDE